MRTSHDLPGTAIRRKLSARKESPMPHSRDSLVLLPGGRSRTLEPPPEFTAGSIERQIFVETVASAPPDHFAGEDVALLAAYCRAMALERRASDELAACATVGNRASPWLDVYATATRAIATHAVRLRIGPRSRSANTRKAKPGLAVSYYDTHPAPRPTPKAGEPWKRGW
jgi:hypothetical protein